MPEPSNGRSVLLGSDAHAFTLAGNICSDAAHAAIRGVICVLAADESTIHPESNAACAIKFAAICSIAAVSLLSSQVNVRICKGLCLILPVKISM